MGVVPLCLAPFELLPIVSLPVDLARDRERVVLEVPSTDGALEVLRRRPRPPVGMVSV